MSKLTSNDLREMADYAKQRALKNAKLAIDDDVPMCLSAAANWATVARFLTEELLQREGV